MKFIKKTGKQKNSTYDEYVSGSREEVRNVVKEIM